MTEAPESFAAATMPLFVALVPRQPAGLLGRLAVEQRQPQHWSRDGESASIAALRGVGALPVERLLGALELAVAAHDWSDAPSMVAGLPPPPAYQYALVGSGGHESSATAATYLLESLRPGLADRTVEVLRRVAADPQVAALLAVSADTGDDAAIAARHGALHLALALAVAGALVEQVDAPVIVDRPAAVVGLAVGAAALLLRQTPMPAAYAAAILAKMRAEYRLPLSGFGSVAVSGHHYGLLEDGFPATTDFSGNGLVAVSDGGVVVRAGLAAGPLHVEYTVLAEPPPEVETGWEEIVEVSWPAAQGGAALSGPGVDAGAEKRGITPPWPGDYRVRVHARDRDEADYRFERHKVVVWAAPAAPEVVHRRTDLLGHRMRGEPEPVRHLGPEYAYRWVQRSRLQVAATVTVASGVSLEQALRAFGADPDRPVRLDAIRSNASPGGHHSAEITGLVDGEHVVLVEDNGFRGSDPEVLAAVSANGRAASMFWNVNGHTRLSFAERGEALAAFEPGYLREVVPPSVARALEGLDLTGHDDRTGKCLVAVERFTGRGIKTGDLTSIDDADIGWVLD